MIKYFEQVEIKIKQLLNDLETYKLNLNKSENISDEIDKNLNPAFLISDLDVEERSIEFENTFSENKLNTLDCLPLNNSMINQAHQLNNHLSKQHKQIQIHEQLDPHFHNQKLQFLESIQDNYYYSNNSYSSNIKINKESDTIEMKSEDNIDNNDNQDIHVITHDKYENEQQSNDENDEYENIDGEDREENLRAQNIHKLRKIVSQNSKNKDEGDEIDLECKKNSEHLFEKIDKDYIENKKKIIENNLAEEESIRNETIDMEKYFNENCSQEFQNNENQQNNQQNETKFEENIETKNDQNVPLIDTNEVENSDNQSISNQSNLEQNIQIVGDKNNINKSTIQKFESNSQNKTSFSFKKSNMEQKSEILDELIDDFHVVEKFKFEINAATMGAIAFDNYCKIVQTNNYFTEKLFYTRIELIGTDLYSLIPTTEHSDFKHQLENLYLNCHKPFQLKFFDKNLNVVDNDINMISLKLSDHTINVIYATKIQNNYSITVIDPNSTFQLSWVAMLSLVLVSLLLQQPQDMVFNDSKVLNALEIPITVFFCMDICVNFNLGYQFEDRIETNRQFIAQKQFKKWFIIDFVSTIPSVDLYETVINTQLIKSLKFVRLIRFMRLIRLFRLTKIFSFIMNKSDSNKMIYKFLKSNQGYMDLLKNMMFIQILAHFWSIIFYSLEGWLCNQQPNCWQKFQSENIKDPLIDDYNQIVYKSIKIALGLDQQECMNVAEIQLSILWMFVGLSMFGYGIGNISSQLSQTNKQELEQTQTMSFFNDLCLLNNIDPRLQTIVMDNIDNFQTKYLDRELIQQAPVLPNHVFEQLELSLYNDFVKQMLLFEKLSIKALRLIKHNIHIDFQKNLLRKDMKIQQIYFILEGCVNLYDKNMNMINQFEKDEIFGLQDFYSYFYHKYKVDIERGFAQHTADTDKKLKLYMKQKLNKKINNKLAKNIFNNLFNKFSDKKEVDIEESKPKNEILLNMQSITPDCQSVKSNNHDSQSVKRRNSSNQVDGNLDENPGNPGNISKLLLKRFQKLFLEGQSDFKQTISMYDDYLTSEFIAIGTDHVKQMILNFEILEEIFFSDIEAIQNMQKQNNLWNRLINESEFNESEKIIKRFRMMDHITMFILPSGKIQDANIKFMSIFDINDINQIQDRNFQDFISDWDNSGERVFKIDDLNKQASQKVKFYFNNIMYEFNIKVSNVTNIIKYDRKNQNFINYHKQAKSLINVYLLNLHSLKKSGSNLESQDDV